MPDSACGNRVSRIRVRVRGPHRCHKFMIDVELPEVPDPNDSWARVERYRWQHGCLPNQPGHEEQPLDESAGLEGMAAAIEKGDRKNFPSPMNVISVLRYAAKLLKDNRSTYERAIDDAIFAAKDALADPPTHQQDELLDNILKRLEDLKVDHDVMDRIKNKSKNA